MKNNNGIRLGLAYLFIALVDVIQRWSGWNAWYDFRNYPYGKTFCSENCLAMYLRKYAERHAGWFPMGEDSPEASLSVLYRDEPFAFPHLAGMTVPVKTVREILERGELLGPTTCGWHYVEGLRNDDDDQLGLFWDKAELGYGGHRLLEGGHLVCRVNGLIDHVRGKDWPTFLLEQEELHKKLKRPPNIKSEVIE